MKRSLKRALSAVMAAAVMLGASSYAGLDAPSPLYDEAYAAAEVNITEAQGWLESAWVEWKPSSTSGVAYYTVSYSKDSSSFITIDDELIRRYGDGHWRADIVGLAPGNYTVKVEAFNSGKASAASETASVTVTAHDRTGLTFSAGSQNAHPNDLKQSGAYNGDGTLKSGAKVLYIKSASDIDNVTYEGYKGLSTILQNRHKQSSAPLAIRLMGKINYSGSQLNGSGYIQIKPGNAYQDINTTIEGIGEDTALNFGFLVRNAGNVELRNFAVHDFKDDGISLDTDNSNIWIHNNEFFYGVQGSGDKAKGDGSTDVKNDSKYVTLSYNHYWDAGKCSLCGMKSEGGENFITYHHNWFDHSDSRHPRIRTMSVWVYNNYYDGVAKYGVGASERSSAFVEANYFRNTHHPTLQGSVGSDADGKGGSTTLDDDNPIGAIKYVNNIEEDTNNYMQFTTDNNNVTNGNGDACKVTDRSTVLNYTTAKGATYNNFDTANTNEGNYIKSNAPESAASARANVEKYAGKTGGGDFSSSTGFAFTSADDKSYDINTTLRSALTKYADNNISNAYVINSIGGSVTGEVTPPKPENPTETTTAQQGGDDKPTETTTSEQSGEAKPVPSGGAVHNFTENDKTSDFYTITGSLATGKPTPTGYKEMTQCLKLESSTRITFNAQKAGTLTLIVTSEASSPGIKIDDISYDVPENGSVNIKLGAGPHTITKDSSSTYLYYMSYVADDEGQVSIMGDTTEDGVVNMDDVKRILDKITGIFTGAVNNGDVNGDGSTDGKDAYEIAKEYVG